jgi:hypothetical protein
MEGTKCGALYVGGMETAEKIGTWAEAEAVAEASRP